MPEFDSTVEYRQIEGFPRHFVGSDGSVWHGVLQLKPLPLPTGYVRVVLNPGSVRRFVHHLVLEAFVGPRPVGAEARHDPDHSPANNCLANLKWGTREQNMRDRDRQGRTAMGERQHLAKMTAEKVRAIRVEYADGVGLSALGRKYGCHYSTIWCIVARRTWKHIA